MVIKSEQSFDLPQVVARHWEIGRLTIEWYVKWRPKESVQFDGNLSVRWNRYRWLVTRLTIDTYSQCV